MKCFPWMIVLAAAAMACTPSRESTDGDEVDSGTHIDAGLVADAGEVDAGHDVDAGSHDAGPPPVANFETVYAILDARCTGCHDAAVGAGDLDLGTADKAYQQLVNRVSTGPFCGQSPHTEVVPNDPEHSLLYQKVSSTMDCGFRMPSSEGPHGPPPLSAQEQQLIYDWIANGATRE